MRLKIRQKNSLIIFLLFINLFLSLTFIKTEIIRDGPHKNKDNKQVNRSPNHLKNSGFWNLTRAPIYIDNSRSNCNWEKISSKYNWCYGSGTLEDPYIIENVIINGKNSGSCIIIRNSNVHFIIRNCILYNSGWSIFNWGSGIKLINTNNGKIVNNNCSYNNGYGILQIQCSNNNISQNIVNYNSYNGIYSWRSDSCLILKNEINYNEINGISFWFCNSNNITGNKINENQNGINLIMSNNNFITFNYLVGNNVSIYQFWSYGNIIRGNKYENEIPAPETLNNLENNNDENNGDSNEFKVQETYYISLIIIGTSLGIISGGIIGYYIQKKRIERKSLFLFDKPQKGKPKAETSFLLEEKFKSKPDFEFVPKGAIMKFEDIKKLIMDQKDVKNNLNEDKKK
ncbi:MAG: nitrous oxide reductase family maturation protein NosD [Promethearchaeota archaeon]